MRWLARGLAAGGFQVRCLGYAGVLGGPQAALPALLRAMRGADAVVAHSLGGLMTLEALQAAAGNGELDAMPARVVCLGSPLAGSSVASGLQRRRLGFALGRSRDLLLRGAALAWAGNVQVGSVAGDRARGVGRALGGFSGPSDGTVLVEETRWPGLADHVVVPASHSGLLMSAPALAQVVRFLREGRFSAVAAGRAFP